MMLNTQSIFDRKRVGPEQFEKVGIRAAMTESHVLDTAPCHLRTTEKMGVFALSSALCSMGPKTDS